MKNVRKRVLDLIEAGWALDDIMSVERLTLDDFFNLFPKRPTLLIYFRLELDDDRHPKPQDNSFIRMVEVDDMVDEGVYQVMNARNTRRSVLILRDQYTIDFIPPSSNVASYIMSHNRTEKINSILGSL